MRLRNNPKAYEIMNENSDFVVIEPEKLKNNWNLTKKPSVIY